MIRHVYRGLIALLPSRFREEFGEEMLWIFDQDEDGQMLYIVDVACSVIRQRLACEALWQSAVAMAAAPLPYLYGLQVWKSLKYFSSKDESERIWLQTGEVAVTTAVLAVCIAGIVSGRRISHRGPLITLRDR